MKALLACLVLSLTVVASSDTARAYDVTTDKAREQNLIEYVAGRTDLSAAERKKWDEAIRLTFGGKAIKDGTDEGVTVAKSVIAGAIFFGISPRQGTKAAYQAYHDTYGWVPPPLAINYQLLAFQGRKPTVSAKRLAFEFPKYFNEDLAPGMVAWWSQQIAEGKVPKWERLEIEQLLADTRALMKPMMLDMLYRGAELQVRKQELEATGRAKGTSAIRIDTDLEDLGYALELLADELESDYSGVASDKEVDGADPYYDRYRHLAEEVGVEPEPPPVLPQRRPSYQPPRAEPETSPPMVAPPPPRAEPEPPPQARTEQPPAVQPRRPTPPVVPFAETHPIAREGRRHRSQVRIEAPMPGDALVELYAGWMPTFNRTVQSWIGTPYLWGGLDRRGIDCSAFVREIFRESFNVELPRNSRAQYRTGMNIASQNQLKPGDLIFFDTMDRGRITHVAVYVGDGEFAHASSSKGVTPAPLAKKYYQRAYWGSRRLLKQ